MNALLPRVLLLTDRRYDDASIVQGLERATDALEPGSFGFVLRELRPAVEARLRALVRAHRGLLVLKGDRLAEDRVGLHVGADLERVPAARAASPDAWISAAAHTDDDVDTAARAGATAVLVSPVFTTPGKGAARGVASLEAALARARATKVYALGGIQDAEGAEVCLRAGAHGVAIVRAAWDDDGARLSAIAAACLRSR